MRKHMISSDQKMTVKIDVTKGICSVGETTGKKNIRESKMPVLSCEGPFNSCENVKSAKKKKEDIIMSQSRKNFSIKVEGMKTVCPLGEVVGNQMIAEGKIPVISCEGGCFRGEIARVASHMVAKEEPFSRGCHGEMFTAPSSAMAEWAKKADKVVVIDGCFMHCHGRIMKNVVGCENMIQFDALPIYNKDNKYSDIMLVDEIPEGERRDLARQVADKVLRKLKKGISYDSESQPSDTEGGMMTIDNARRFIVRLRQDQNFRKRALATTGPQNLLLFLEEEGLPFNQRELVGAMAECMEQLES